MGIYDHYEDCRSYEGQNAHRSLASEACVHVQGSAVPSVIQHCPVVVPRPSGNTGKNFVKFFVKLCAEEAPKTPLRSALSY